MNPDQNRPNPYLTPQAMRRQVSSADSASLESTTSSQVDTTVPLPQQTPPPKRKRTSKRTVVRLIVIGILLLGTGVAALIIGGKPQDKSLGSDATQRFSTTSVPLTGVTQDAASGLSSLGSVSINGKLNVSSSLVLAPTVQPSSAVAGQLYFDRNSGKLSIFNGSGFDSVASGNNIVSTLGGKSGAISLGNGLGLVGNQLSSTGVLSLQGQTGNVRLSTGAGISITGTAISNTGVVNLGGATGAIAIGNGLVINNNTLSVSGAVSNGGNLSSTGGTTGRLAYFTGTQTLADSMISQSSSGVTVNGDLTVTGTINLGTPLSVAQGGTGLQSLSANQLLFADTANTISQISNGTTGQCLISNGAGAPSFQACPSVNGVTTVNGQNGAITIAGTTDQIIVTNSGGNVTLSTPQNLSTTSSVTFNGVTATTFTGNGAAVTNVNAAQLGGQNGAYYTNATNISAGTLSDSRLTTNVTLQGNTFNGASQLVQLNGAGYLPSLNGSLLTALNGTAITAGSIADARLTTNVALYNNTTSNFTGNLQQNGNAVCTTAGNCNGAGGAITGGGTANKVALFTGSGYSIGDSLLSQDGGATTVSINGALSVSGAITATSFSGNGAAVTNVNAAQLGSQNGAYYTNASNITSGTLNNSRLSTSVTLQGNTFNGPGQLVQTDASGYLPALNASALTNINASALATGTVADGRLSGNVALYNAATANFTGTLQQNGNNVCTTAGNCNGAGGAITGGGTLNKIPVYTGSGYSIGNSIISQNSGATAVTISGDLSVTGNLSATNVSGNGSGLTNVNAAQLGGQSSSYYTNATNLSSGTVADARLSTNVALLNASNNFTGTNLQHNGNNVCDASNNCGYLTGASASGAYVAFANASAQVNTSANASVFINNTGSATGLITLQQNGSNVFTISNTGAVTATSFSGDGSAVTNVNAALLQGQNGAYYTNASNISSGTLADGRLSSNVALKNVATNFTASLQHNGNDVCDASNNCGYLTSSSANGSYVAFANASVQVNSSANASIYINNTGGSGLIRLQSGGSDVFTVANSGAVTATSYSGNGAGLTNVNAAQLQGQNGAYYTNASNINSGTLSDSRLSTNVALQNGNNNFTGTLQHNSNDVCDASNNCGYLTSGSVSGSYVQFANASAQNNSTTNSAIFINNTGGASNLVQLQASGVDKYIVTTNGAVTATSFTGNGANVTNVNAAQLQGQNGAYYTNATNISSGTLADGRLSSNVALLNANNNFTGTNLQHNGNNVCDASNNCGYLSGAAASGSYVQFAANSAQANSTANAAIFINSTGSATNLIRLQQGGADRFTVNNSGKVTATSLNLTNLLSGSGDCLVINSGTHDIGTATCAAGSGGAVNPTLQNVYDNSASSPAILLNNGSGGTGGVVIQDSTTTAGSLFAVKNNAGTTSYLNVTNTGVSVTGSVSANSLNGNGSGVTNVNAAQLNGNSSSYYTNASNISSGTLADGYLSSNVALYNASTANFTGTLQHNGNAVCDTSNNCNYLTSASANNNYVQFAASSAQVNSTTNASIYINSTGGAANLIRLQAGGVDKFIVTNGGAVTASSFSGDGSNVTNVNAVTLQGQSASYFTNASNITTGTLADGRLSSNVALLSASNNFTGTNLQHNGNNVCDASNNCGYLSGAAANGAYVQFANSTVQANATTNASIYINSTGGATNLIDLQTNGTDRFVVSSTGAVIATSFSGNGAGVTNVNATQLNSQSASYYTNATNISSGTLADGRLSSNVALLSASNNFTGTNLQHNGNNVCDASNNCGYLTSGSASGFVQFAATSVQNNATANDSIYINSTGGATNLLRFQTGGTDKFVVNNSGNITAGTFNGASITGGTISGGSLTSNSVNGLAVGSNSIDTTGTGTLTIGSANAALVLGSAAKAFTLQGSSSSVITAKNGSYTTTIGFSGTATGNVTYNFDASAATGTYTICTTANNCVANGSAGGDLTGSYPNPTVARIRGTNVNFGTLSNGDVLQYNGTDIVNGKVTNTNLASGNFTNITGVGVLGSLAVGSGSALQIDASGNFQTTGTATATGLVSANGGLTVGGGKTFTNSGATVNTATSLSYGVNTTLPAATTVDTYTYIGLAATASNLTFTIPAPTAGSTYGRIIYVTNTSTNAYSFSNTYLTALLNPGATATLIWANVNGTGNWSYAGADGSSILNQNSVTQTANFNINGTGTAATSLQSPSFDSTTSSLAIGNSTATTINIGTTATARSVFLGTGGANQTIQIGTTTGSSTLQLSGGNGASAVLLQAAGSGGIVIGSANAVNTVTIGNSTATSGTETVNIGTSIGTGATTAVSVGNNTGASSLNLTSGTGNTNIMSTGAVNIGTSTATGVSISRSGYNTLVNGTLTATQLLTANAGITIAGTTVFGTVALGDLASGAIGSASSTVDIYTAFSINPSASGRTYTIPNPTNASLAGRILFISNISSNSFTVSTTSTTIPAGASANFLWNGSSWTTTAVSTGVSVIGSFSLSSQPNGASISGNTITFGPADGTNPGMVSATGTQTFGGTSKIFTSILSVKNTSTSAFVVGDGSANPYLSVDTSTSGGVITIGNGANKVTFQSGGYSASGTYQNTKNINLTAEYAGAVVDAASDSSCSSANNGIMASGFDSGSRQNFYQWSASTSGTQCYDVVVQVPVPSDWASWTGTPTLYTYNSNGTNSTSVYVQAIGTNGTTDSNYGGYVAVSSGTSMTATNLTALDGTNYTAGGYMTLKIRLSSGSTSTNVRIGNINIPYKSKF